MRKHRRFSSQFGRYSLLSSSLLDRAALCAPAHEAPDWRTDQIPIASIDTHSRRKLQLCAGGGTRVKAQSLANESRSL